MRYEEFYKQELDKYIKRKKILKNLGIFSVVLAVLLLGFSVLFFMSGTPYNSELKAHSYGDTIEAPTSFLAESEYEYFVDGAWKKEPPSAPGKYTYRICSRNLFGRISYSKESTFEIKKRRVVVQVTDTEVEYGKEPKAQASLLPSDTLIKCDFIYDSLVLADTYVSVDPESIVIFSNDGHEIHEYYEFETPKSEIHFTSVPIVIRMLDKEKVYDGTPLASLEYELEGDLPNGDQIKLSSSSSITNAGTETNNVDSIEVFSIDGKKVENYRIEVVPSTLTVIPLEITLSTEKLEDVIFDGKVHSYQEVTSSVVLPDTLVVEPIEVFEAKTYSYSPTYDIVNKDGSVKGNYLIHENFQSIIVSKAKVTILPEDISHEYDGQSVFTNRTNYQIQSGDLFGYQLIYSAKANQAYGKNIALEITSYTVFSGTIEYTSCFDVEFMDFTVDYTPRTITIRPVDEKKEYDGLLYTSNAIEIVEGSLVLGDEITAMAESQGCSIASHTIEITSLSIKKNTIDVTEYYTIKKETGTLLITPRAITIQPKSTSVSYGDSVDLSVQIASGSLLDGDEIIVDASAFSYEMNLGDNEVSILPSSYTIEGMGENHLSYYSLTLKTGTLTITRRCITISIVSKTIVYDGISSLSYTDSDLGYKGSLVDGDSISFTAPQITLSSAASYTTKLSTQNVSITNGSENKLDYYEIEFKNGALTILQKDLYFISESKCEVYTEYYKTEPLTGTDSSSVYGLCDTHSISKEQTKITGSLSTVGTTKNTVDKLVIVDINNVDVTDNYNVIIYEGTLTLVEPNTTE